MLETSAAIDRYLRVAPLAEATRRAYAVDLAEFGSWLRARGETLDAVDAGTLADYTAALGASRPGRDPNKLAPTTVARKLAAVRGFLRHALGPSRAPEVSFAPRRGRRLPQAPKLPEVDETLAALEPGDAIGLRNRALVELVYSAGLRSREAVDLDLADVRFDEELVRVRGKGGKERAVPLGEEAAYWLGRYLRDARPHLARGANDALFLSARGRRLDTSTLRRLVPHPAPPPPRLRNAPARGRRRPAGDPGAARPQLALDHAGVQPRRCSPPAPGLRPVAPEVVAASRAAALASRDDWTAAGLASFEGSDHAIWSHAASRGVAFGVETAGP